VKTTRLIAVLAGFAAIAMVAADAQAIYHPRMGRFMQRDPAGYRDGMNRFEYVRSNPLVLVDSYGRQASQPAQDKSKVCCKYTVDKHDTYWNRPGEWPVINSN